MNENDDGELQIHDIYFLAWMMWFNTNIKKVSRLIYLTNVAIKTH